MEEISGANQETACIINGFSFSRGTTPSAGKVMAIDVLAAFSQGEATESRFDALADARARTNSSPTPQTSTLGVHT